jgi:hypothetical protein
MRTLILACAAALLACACRHLEPAHDPPYYPEASKDPYAGREWFALGLAIVDRDSDDFAEVSDALGVTLDGGYELSRDAWRPSLEFGTAWADHEVRGPSGTFDLDFWRLSFGLNLALRVEDQAFVPWVRGGLFYRWGNGTPEELADQDGRGYYLGLGFDVATQPGLGIGPAVTWYRGAEDDVEELYYGLVARFRF